MRPLKPTLQQGFSDSIKTSLEPASLISNQHQPGLNSSLKATSLERGHPQSDRRSEQNIAQLLLQSITAAELLSNQWIFEEGFQQRLQGKLLSSR